MFKKMIVGFVATFMLLARIEGTEIHAVIAGANLGEGGGFECSIDLMHRAVRNIAAATGLPLNVTKIENFQMTFKNVSEHLNQLNVQPDDIVILYLVIHGGRHPNKENRWPDQNYIDGSYDFNLLNEILKSKQPRLILSIAESCNGYTVDLSDGVDEFDDSDDADEEDSINYLHLIEKPKAVKESPELLETLSESMDEDIIEKYQTLFLKQSGSIIISTSSPGETSSKHPLLGGLFTLAFLDCLEHWRALDVPLVSWEQLINEATSKMDEYNALFWDKHHHNHKQTPQYELELQGFNFNNIPYGI